jgi:hypothetical protein
MFSEKAGKYCIHCEKVNEKVRVYAYKDELKKVSVLAVNWDTTNSYCAKIVFSGILKGSSYSCTMPPFSLSSITFSPDMKDTAIFLYTKNLAMFGPVPNTSPKFKAQFKKKKKRVGLRIRPLG